MYLVQNVKGRSGIRIHSGNVAGRKDLGLRTHFAGCIAFGKFEGVMHGQRAVMATGQAIHEIEKFLDYKDFTLIIIGEFHE
jgi:hypothetical protein